MENVQAAADLGGPVLLKAADPAGRPIAFNFGTVGADVCDRQVALDGAATLLGETVDGHQTTIRGGYRPILVGLTGGWCDPNARFSPNAGHVRIEGIHFDRFHQAAIDVYRARGVDIRNNRLSDVVTLGNIGVGISIFGGGGARRVTGPVSISDNVIRWATSGATFVHGVVLDDVPADVEIEGNVVETTQDFSGILVVRHVEGKVRIAHNHVAASSTSPGDGLGIYIYANDRWNSVRTAPPEYEVVSNRVITGGIGIGLAGQRGSIEAARVARNHVSTSGTSTGAAAISLMGNVWGARVSSNIIEGTAPFGVEIVPFVGTETAYSNTLSGNNMAGFAAGSANVLISALARDTVVVGHSGTVVDDGTRSEITGMAPVDGRHVGSQMRHASWAGEPMTGVLAPAEVSGTGAAGSTSYSITTGYTGDLVYAKHGLIPAATTDATVADDPADNFDVASPGANSGVTAHDLFIPAGTSYTRISLFDEHTDGADDLDLYVYRINADASMTLVGRSVTGTSREEVNLPQPAGGAYKVYVHGWQTDGSDATYRLFSWVLGTTDQGNLAVTGPVAVMGEQGTVQASWSGLTPGLRYLGQVEYLRDGASLGTTIVRVNA